ncbi:hypothetical protein [Fischerella thermalis]|uniref:hypothetical protein n=1 Tax=Fischerella thermalis TaxID=372787 RepID=UPI0015E100AC|nr:hypothetical protein [Fischerella thermalis]
MGMNNEPPRCQERQELSFSIKRENKIILLSLQRQKTKNLTPTLSASSDSVPKVGEVTQKL